MMKKLTAIFATLSLIASCAFGAETAAADGKCYVHACLASASEYGYVKVGDTVTVQGTFHILSNDWGVTLKGTKVKG